MKTNKSYERMKKAAVYATLGAALLTGGNYAQASALPIDTQVETMLQAQAVEVRENKRKEAYELFNGELRTGKLSNKAQYDIRNNLRYVVEHNGTLDEKESRLYDLLNRTTDSFWHPGSARKELESTLKSEGMDIKVELTDNESAAAFGKCFFGTGATIISLILLLRLLGGKRKE